MLSRINRIGKQKDFDRVFKEGKAYYDKFLLIKLAPNRLDFSRFGPVISSKVSKKAVERNRLRRQVNEIFRLELERVKKGFDIVFIAKPGLLKYDYEMLKNVLMDLFKKAGLLEKK